MLISDNSLVRKNYFLNHSETTCKHLDPFLTSGLVNPYHLDEFICSFRSYGEHFHFYCILQEIPVSKHFVASELDLHCLHESLKQVSCRKRVKTV